MTEQPTEQKLENSQPPASGEGKTVRKHDFTQHGRLAAEQARVLRLVNEAVSQRLAKGLTEFCRCSASVKAGELEELSAEEVSARLQEPQPIILFEPAGRDSRGLLALNGKLAAFMVDRMLGGSGEAAGERPLSELERQVAAEGSRVLLHHFAQVWAKLIDLTPRVLEVWCEGLPEDCLVGISRAVVSRFSVQLSELTGELDIYLLLPNCNALISALTISRWSAGRAAANAEDRARIMQVIEEVELPVAAVLGAAQVPLANLLTISVGDIVCLETEEADALQLWAGGRPALAAKPVRIDGRLAVCVSGELQRGGR